MTQRFKVKKVHEDAKLPVKATTDAVGYDCFAVSMKVTDLYIEYDLGIIVVPEDPNYYVEVLPRSSVTKKHLMLKNSVGIIDPDYRDTIKVRFGTAEGLGIISMIVEVEPDGEDGFIETGSVMNITRPIESDNKDMPLLEIYKVGERVCQLVIRERIQSEFYEVEELDETERTGGFGSTGQLEI